MNFYLIDMMMELLIGSGGQENSQKYIHYQRYQSINQNPHFVRAVYFFLGYEDCPMTSLASKRKEKEKGRQGKTLKKKIYGKGVHQQMKTKDE
jgi:hypothetical protein